jgi:type I restriction enzyme S subunit
MSNVVLNELPKNWEWTKLGDVITKIVGGGTPSKKNKKYWGGNIPWLTIKDMRSRRPADTIDHITQDAVDESSTNLIPADTVIMATRVGLGKVVRVPYDTTINQDLKALITPSELDKSYLEYWLVLKAQYLESIGSGTTVKGIRLEQVRELDFPFAPLEQQKCIVAKIEELFSHIDAGIEALNKAKQLLKQYRQSVLKAAVTGELTKEWREQNKDKLEPASQLLERILQERRQKWEEQQLEQFKTKDKMPKDDKWRGKYKVAGEPIIESSEGVPKEWCIVRLDAVSEIIDSLHQTPKYSEEGYPMARVTEIKGGDLDLTNAYRVNEEVFLKFTKRYQPKQGDILISRVGTYGNASIVVTDEDFCLGQNTAVICPSINSDYLHRVLESKYAKNQIDRLVVGSTQKTLSLKNMAGLSVTIPSISEQEVIVEVIGEKIDSIIRLEDEIASQLLKAEKNKQSILASAFSGRIL